jgi:shikimate kinase
VITLIAGPPCSGKTTLAAKLAQVGDTVLDWDEVYAQVTGLPLYDQPPGPCSAVDAEYRRRLGQLRSGVIVRAAPRKQHRAVLRRIHQARTVVLEIPASECLRRLEASDRPEVAKAKARVGIAQWWREYEPSVKDSRMRAPA